MAYPTDPIYKLHNSTSSKTNPSCIMKALGNNRFLAIPIDQANTDYAEYLKWVAAGNTAEAAD